MDEGSSTSTPPAACGFDSRPRHHFLKQLPLLGAEWDRVALQQRWCCLSSGTEGFFFCGREAKYRSQGGAAALRLQCHLHAIATKKFTITSVIRNFFRSSSLYDYDCCVVAPRKSGLSYDDRK